MEAELAAGKRCRKPPGQSWASGTDHKCVSRVLASCSRGADLMGLLTRPLWGLPQLDKGLGKGLGGIGETEGSG